MLKRQAKTGFTIVELLIVIVVIAILAAITVVAYNGIQQRARDAERTQELSSIQKALEMYRIDNGGYPRCGSTGPNTSPYTSTYNTATLCLEELVPNYINAVPTDPTNNGDYQYWYAAGYKKTSETSHSPAGSGGDNYIMGARLEGKPVTYTAWYSNNLNILLGSSN